MKFSKEIGTVLFDGYWKGGADNDPKKRQGKSEPKPYDEAVQQFPFMLGKIKTNVVMTDYDNREAFECRVSIAKALEEHCVAIRSPNKGGHIYWFNRKQTVKVSNTGNRTVLTLSPVDFKCGIRHVKSSGEVKAAENYGCLSNPDKTLREVVYCKLTDTGELDEIPFYDLPMKSDASFLGMKSGDGRNNGLLSYMIPMKSAGYSYEQYKTVAELIDGYIFGESLPEDEFETVTRRDAWNTVSVSCTQFGSGSTFQHNKFAEYLIGKYHIKKINGQLHIFQNSVYVPGLDKIEAAMIDEIDWIKKRQRNEVLDYLAIRCKEVSPCGFNYIAFNNGVYNIDTNELEPFRPDIVITNKIPWDYNPDAESELVNKVLDKLSCNDEEIRYLLEEVAGACLYRSNTLGGGRMIVLTGEKSNGKSTFLDMLKAMIGEENYSTLDIKEVGDRFSTAMMFGKLANIGDDISSGYLSDVSQLKKIVTGNTIKAENKCQNPFNFSPYCSMIFSANDVPKTNDKTGAMQRRLLIVPMNAEFSKSDPDYDPAITYKLQQKEAIEYLIQLALDGLVQVLDNKSFTEPKEVKKALDEYAVENNPVLAFIEELKNDTGEVEGIYNEPTRDVYLRFETFCTECGYKPMSKLTFSKRINQILKTETKEMRLPGSKKAMVFVKK